MAAVGSRLDDLVKDYLMFRGLTGTLRTLENELKTEKEKGLRVDKVLEQIQTYINMYDLCGLREYWAYLNHKFFSRLEQKYMSSVRKLEVGLLKFYLVNASQNNRSDKVREYFEIMTPELQNQSEFKEWFTFPFIRIPEENNHFSLYFTRQWQDTFFLSLHNFISVILQAMPVPTLLSFEHDQRRMKCLQEENEMLKIQIRSNIDVQPKVRYQTMTSSMELMDDFFSISENSSLQETQSQNRSEKKFFHFPSSPLLRKKPGNTKPPPPNNETSKPLSHGQSLGRSEIRNNKLEPEHEDNHNVPVKTTKKFNAIAQSHTGQILPHVAGSIGGFTGGSVASSHSAVQATPAVVGSSAEPRPRKPTDDHEKLKREQKLDIMDKQRRELFGTSEPDNRKHRVHTRSGENNSPVHVPKVELSVAAGAVTLPSQPQKSDPSATTTAMTTMTPANFRESNRDNSKSIPGRAGAISPLASTRVVDDLPNIVSTYSDSPLIQEEYTEHHSAISTCSFSNTGQYIVSADVDGVVKVWSWSPQPETRATIMSKSSFLSLSWTSKTDRLLLLGNKSGNIKLYDVKDTKTICDVMADPNYPRLISLCANPAGSQFVCSGSVEKHRSGSGGERSAGKVGRLSVWELKSMKMVSVLPVGPGPVAINCCSYNHNGQLLLTGGADGAIRLFDMRQMNCICQWPAHEGEVISVQFSSDETTCYSMGIDGKFMQWSINNRGRKVADLPIHPGACQLLPPPSPNSVRELPKGNVFAFDSEGIYVLTCTRSGGLIYQRTSEAPGLAKTMELKGHTSAVATVDWSPSVDTRVCLTGDVEGKIKVSTLLSR